MTTTYMTCDLWFGKKHLVIAQAKCWHVTFIIGYTFLNMYLEMLGYKSAILSLLCIRCQLFIRRRRWQRNGGDYATVGLSLSSILITIKLVVAKQYSMEAGYAKKGEMCVKLKEHDGVGIKHNWS